MTERAMNFTLNTDLIGYAVFVMSVEISYNLKNTRQIIKISCKNSMIQTGTIVAFKLNKTNP